MKEQDIRHWEIIRNGTVAEVNAVLEQFSSNASICTYLKRDLIGMFQVADPASDFDDLMIETQVHFWTYLKKDRFRGDCSLKTLFCRIAKNRWIDTLRKQSRYTPLDTGFDMTDPESMDIDIPGFDRKAVLMHIFNEWKDDRQWGANGTCPH